MARLAWVTMTRVTADRQQPVTPEPRVDAGVKELNEMTIGRTDDPENPLGAKACEAASVFGTGSRTPSGPAVMAPRRQAGHMIAIDPPVRFLIFSLASKGPSTHAPTRWISAYSNAPSSAGCAASQIIAAWPRSQPSKRRTPSVRAVSVRTWSANALVSSTG